MFLFWRFISIADHSWSHSNCSLQSYDKSQPFLKSKQFLFVPCVRKPCWWMWINKRNLSLKFWLTISDLKKTNKDSSVEAGMQICVRDTKLACRGDNSLSLGILYFCILVLREILYRASAIHRSCLLCGTVILREHKFSNLNKKKLSSSLKFLSVLVFTATSTSYSDFLSF